MRRHAAGHMGRAGATVQACMEGQLTRTRNKRDEGIVPVQIGLAQHSLIRHAMHPDLLTLTAQTESTWTKKRASDPVTTVGRAPGSARSPGSTRYVNRLSGPVSQPYDGAGDSLHRWSANVAMACAILGAQKKPSPRHGS